MNTISNIQLGLSRNEKCSKIRANKGHSNGENDEPWGWNRGTLVDWPSCALIFLAEKAWALCRWLFYHTGLFEHIPIGYGSIPIDTFLVGWTSINPSYELGFTRYQGFDPSPILQHRLSNFPDTVLFEGCYLIFLYHLKPVCVCLTSSPIKSSYVCHINYHIKLVKIHITISSAFSC